MDEHMQSFMTYLSQDKRLAANSLDSYARDLNGWFRFLRERSVDEGEEISPALVSQYLFTLKQEGKAPATVNRALVALRSYYQYLVRQRLAIVDPTAHIPSPRVERKTPHVLTMDELDRLLEAPATDEAQGLRDKALLETLYATGIRVSELVTLDTGDVSLELSFLRCAAEGGRERIVPLGRTAVAWLGRYLDEARGQLVKEEHTEAALFVNHRGTRLTRQGLWKLIKKYAELAGIGSELTPHSLRHSFAAHLMENGADLRSVQEMLGLNDPASAQIYAAASKSRMKEVYDRAHPRAKR